MQKVRLAVLVGTAFLGMSAAATAAAPRYHLTPLAAPAGSVNSAARAISANGKIAGEAFLTPGGDDLTPVSYGTAAAPLTTVLAQPVGTGRGFLRGINNSGIAAGAAQDIVNNRTSAILAGLGGTAVLGAASGFANAGATGINNGGAAAGYSMSIGIFNAEGTARPISSAEGTMAATVWDVAGSATTLANPFGNFNSLAAAINAAGQIAGAANNGTGGLASRAVIWSNGVGTALDTSGSDRSTARALSSTGWVAGRTDQISAGTFIAAAWSDAGTRFDLAPVGNCVASDARSINTARNVVGFGQTATAGACGSVHPVTGVGFNSVGAFWQWNGAGYDTFAINDLVVNLNGWDLAAPQGINDLGQIVGFGVDELGNTRSFVLSAVPEPSIWAMLIAGFGLVGAVSRRRRIAVAA